MGKRIDKVLLKEKLAEGLTYKQIADCFGVKEESICTKVSLMRKSGELIQADRRVKDKPLKHSCGNPNCNTCKERCAEYMVAKLLLDKDFMRIEGVGFVRL